MKKLRQSLNRKFYKIISLLVMACFILNMSGISVYAAEKKARDNKNKNEQVMKNGKTDTSETGLISAKEAMRAGKGERVSTMSKIGNMSEEEVDSVIEIDEEGGVIRDKNKGNKVVAVYNAEKEEVLGYVGQSDIVYYQALVNRKKEIGNGKVKGSKKIEKIESSKEYVVSEISKQSGVSEEEVSKELEKSLIGKNKDEVDGTIGLLSSFFEQGGNIINCAITALGEVLNVASKGVLGLQSLLIEISTGLFEKNNASLIKSGKTQLMTSMETMKEMMELYEQDAIGVAKKVDVFVEDLKEGEKAIVWVNEDHYITVTKLENGNYTIADPNINKGKPVEYNAKSLKSVLSGKAVKDVNGKLGISYEGLGQDGKIRVLTASEELKEQVKEGKVQELSKIELENIVGANVVMYDLENGVVRKSSSTTPPQTESEEDGNEDVNNNNRFREMKKILFQEVISKVVLPELQGIIEGYLEQFKPFIKNVFNKSSVIKEENIISLNNSQEIRENADLLYDYLQKNNTDFLPGSKADIQKSIDFSNSPEVLEQVQQAFAIYGKNFGVEVDSDTKVIFMYGTNTNSNSACACCDINTILIPIDDSDDIPSAQDIYVNIAHEYTHILNYPKVQSGEMTKLDDEVMATENGIMADTTYSKNLTIQTMYNGQQTVNFVSGMELLCFYSIMNNQDEIVEQFKQLTGKEDIDFKDIYYRDVVFAENKLGIPYSSDLSSGEVGITLEYNGAKIIYVTDTGIDINEKYQSISVDGEVSHRVETLSIVKDKELIETTIGYYTNDTFTGKDVIDSFELVVASKALIEAFGTDFGFSMDSLQYVNYDFPTDSVYSRNGDVIRFYLMDEENGNTYSVDVKKDMGIVQISDVSNEQSIWTARENFSKPIEERNQSSADKNNIYFSMSILPVDEENTVSGYEYIHDLSIGNLKQIVGNSDSDITTRYLAFLELKEKGENVVIPNDMKVMAKEYLASVMNGETVLITDEEKEKGHYKNANDKLKASLAMVYDIMLDSYIGEFDIDNDTLNQIWSNIYNNTEIFTEQPGFANADFSFQVEAMMPDIMAHEIMHNITNVYLGEDKNITAKSLGEFSSDIARIILYKQLGIEFTQDLKDEYKEESGYMKTGASPIEEHHLARGVIGILIDTSIKIEMDIDWDGMMSAVAQCFKSDSFMNTVNSNDYSQSIAKILTQYLAISGGNPTAIIFSTKNETSEIYQNILKMFNFAQF